MSEHISILLVDDDQADCLVIDSQLSQSFKAQYSLTIANSYDQALSLIAHHTYDVCLVDYMLVNESGLELIKEVLNFTNNTLPVILITGMDPSLQQSPESGQTLDMEAFSVGANDYLNKSEITPALLARTIKYAIERKKTEKKLRDLAHYDTLTGLVNRAYFQSQLSQCIAFSQRNESIFAVLLLDLDHFKQVNDSFGHIVGDTLLKKVSEVLKVCFRKSDIVARLGGDEFAVIATHLKHPDEANILADKVLEAFKQPVVVEGYTLQIQTSIGIAMCPFDGQNFEALLKNADLALYKAKELGKGVVQVYDETHARRIMTEQTMKADIIASIQQDRFRLALTPIVDYRLKRVDLVKFDWFWQHQAGQTTNINTLLNSQMNKALGGIILEPLIKLSADFHAQWNEAFMPAINCVFKLPAALLSKQNLQLLSRLLSQYEVSKLQWVFTVAEKDILALYETDKESFNLLLSVVPNIAIDHLGSGYGLLPVLKRINALYCEVSEVLVDGYATSQAHRVMLKHIVQICQELDIKVCVPNINDELVLQEILKLGDVVVSGRVISTELAPEPFDIWYKEAFAT